jgi:hypothetical protein
MPDLPCSWDVTCEACPAFETWEEATRDSALWLASTYLWAATGRRYGVCPTTIRPAQSRATESPAYRDFSLQTGADGLGFPGGPFLFGGRWFNAGCNTACCGDSACAVVLRGPVAAVDEVVVDGEVVPASAYRVDVTRGTYLLVRVDGECWPVCARSDEDFSVTYDLGVPIPEALAVATAILACEYGAFLAGGACRLPSRMTSLTRQGVSVELEAPNAAGGTTGIREVDDVVLALNPSRRQSPPILLSPDLPETCDRMTIIAAGS